MIYLLRLLKSLALLPGRKYRSIKRPRVYEALRRKGYSKSKSAKIANTRHAKGKRQRRK